MTFRFSRMGLAIQRPLDSRFVQRYDIYTHRLGLCRTYFASRNLQAPERNENDFYDLSNKLDITDFESTKLMDETEHGTHIDYMAENDDHYFGKWDPPPAASDTTADDIKIQVPSPKHGMGKRISIGDILQESMKLGNMNGPLNDYSHEKEHSNGFDASKQRNENTVFKTDIDNVMTDSCISDDAPHVEENLSSEENQPHELLVEADELLHTTELEIEENEMRPATEKWMSTSWLEDSIMGMEGKKTTSSETPFPFPRGFVNNSKSTQKNSSVAGNFPWNHDLGEFSSSAGRGRHRK